MFRLFPARAVTNVLAFIVNPSYCIQINSSEGEKGGVCVCFGGLFDRQLAYKHE